MTEVTPLSQSQDPLLEILAAAPKEARRGNLWRWMFLIGAVLITWFYFNPFSQENKNSEDRYVTEDAITGNLIVTVSATGTLQPTTSIDVGSEQSGTLISVPAQENDHVKKGQILAQLDIAKLQDTVTKSKAALAVSKAAVAQAQATVTETKASLSRLRRVAELSGGEMPAKTELDTAEAALQRAIANVASARALVIQSQAELKTNETNLFKANIRSPIDGVVLTRKVEPGQTVVASMSTPVLFTLAENLTTMELDVKVDEADVGNVKIGQPATFTVAAWPKRNFPASIQRVGIGSTISDNVVTYKTVLIVNNDDLALRPGMTATASIVIAKRENVLLVPNAALRFTPQRTHEHKNQDIGLIASLLPYHPPSEPRKRRVTANAADTPKVWVLTDGKPRGLSVTTGVTNGRLTEITSGELKSGMAVITDYKATKS